MVASFAQETPFPMLFVPEFVENARTQTRSSGKMNPARNYHRITCNNDVLLVAPLSCSLFCLVWTINRVRISIAYCFYRVSPGHGEI